VASTTERVPARDGSSRLIRRWRTAADAGADTEGEPWAHLLLLHGLGEHSGRYEAVGEWLAAAGIAVHALDHRGFGGSDGPRGDIDRWDRYHDDVEDRLERIRTEAGSLPIVLYGHSMGGLIALGYVLASRPRPRPDLLVLSSPGLEANIPAWKRGLVHVLARIAPRMTLPNGVPGDILSRDPAVGAAYVTDPLNCHRSTARLARLGFVEQARVRAAAAAGRLDLPTYVFHGAEDRLVPPAASAPLARIPGVDRVVLPGLRHETHNEPEGRAVVGAAIDWLRNRVAGAPTEHAGD
jgi:alpha-beta hydrolase superfamily lysophospholipase